MPFITFDDWSGGLDVRPAAQLSKANLLRVLINAYIGTGKSIKKRPCLEFIATLEAGTKGLRAFNGKLNTFYGSAGATITHADSRFQANRVAHSAHPAVAKLHFCEQFSAKMYVAVEYDGGTVRHHYLDDPGVWVSGTNYAMGDFRRPTVPNGFRYEVTADAGSAAGVEPTWPTTIGVTVVDGGITWTCRSFAIADVNCPHTKQVAKQSQKIFAAGVDGTTVPFTATGAPRDWTTASDAGFLPVGLYAQGEATVTALAPFKKKSIGVFFADNAQVWFTDPDPDAMELTDNIASLGTIYSRAAAPVQADTFFHAPNGFRSLAFSTLSDNLQDNDVGSAIDSLVRPATLETDDPISVYYPKLGQFWEINGAVVWAYSFSRSSKLSAWSKFTFPFSIDDATVLRQELYVRAGDNVYKMSEAVFKDGPGDIPLVEIHPYYNDGKVPGVLKQILGMDVMGTGQPTIAQRYYDEDGVERSTSALEYPAMTEQGPTYPVELNATRIAPTITHQRDEAFELAHLAYLYEKLGAV